MGGFSSLCRDVGISLTSNRQRRKDKMQELAWGMTPRQPNSSHPSERGSPGTPIWAGHGAATTTLCCSGRYLLRFRRAAYHRTRNIKLPDWRCWRVEARTLKAPPWTHSARTVKW